MSTTEERVDILELQVESELFQFTCEQIQELGTGLLIQNIPQTSRKIALIKHIRSHVEKECEGTAEENETYLSKVLAAIQ